MKIEILKKTFINMKIANKREQSQTCLSFAKRKQFASVSWKTIIMAGILILAFSACNQKPEAIAKIENSQEVSEGGLTTVLLTAQQFNALGMKVDTLFEA